MKNLLCVVVVAVLCLSTVGCAEVPKTDADRYVRGEYGGMVLAPSATDGTPVTTGAVYAICNPAGQVQIVRLLVGAGGNIATELIVVNIDNAGCGNRLARLVTREQAYALIEREVAAGGNLSRIKEIIKNTEKNIRDGGLDR
ncbi:MAG: hypothetical protein A2944_00645 [Candidatus Zambryskibacteria bacterium RIFCSPLOWO2_01_FULL_52_12]|nr:MAG: hypothetical protein A2944_00645 [Candidatus Zambryskibacteria bacterium RIFCSPLOWO2_01_FULL_52_12]